MPTTLKQPKPPVRLGDLDGPAGNAYNIMARATDALKRAGATPKYVERYFTDATSGDYAHLLSVTRRYVNVIDQD